MDRSVLLLLLLWFFDGVVTKIESISVMEGESVFLPSGVTEIDLHDKIMWTFGSQHTTIAVIYSTFNSNSNIVNSDRFKDRLHVDSTGSLTIKNMKTTDSGTYYLNNVKPGYTAVESTTFDVTVYASLPTPTIQDFTNCSSQSVPSCSVVCSVVNVSHVTLSWLKGNSVLSSVSDIRGVLDLSSGSDINSETDFSGDFDISISVSDLRISLSLPLEVEDQEKNTYSCEIRNPIRNQTTQLDISHHCKPCPTPAPPLYLLALIPVVLGLGIFFYWFFRHK